MDSLDQTSPEQSVSLPARSDRRSVGRMIFFMSMTFLLGIAVGVGGVLCYVLSIASDRHISITSTPSASGAIVVQMSSSYISYLVTRNVNVAGLPGEIKNLQVKLVHDGPITVTGDDHFSFLNLSFTRHFTLQMQPVVSACQLRLHVVHADLEGIPITGFVATFEDQINQQLHVDASILPSGFTYCMTSIHTEVQGIAVTYSAKPV